MCIKEPKDIFFSGYRAPSIIRQKENIYTLPDYDFMKKVMNLGGTPKELMKSQKLLEMFILIIRNDFKILENYKYKERKNKMECNVSVLNGKQDDIKLEEILAWKNHVSKEVKIYNFEGNHFFINTNVEKITNIINNTLTY
ncbi:thioesterase II family protein [Clostridium saccharoperbutylacetonicum]|uniref:thioesterase II family protein n=1 Tax=Clostridium saccharoperbutylacetonicum TaxID=36745 RepID=UPI0039EB0C00